MSDFIDTLRAFYSLLPRVRPILAGLAFLFCLSVVQNTAAANFVVTRVDDRDANCISGTDCALREAVNAANATADDDTISFDIPAADCDATAEVCTVTLTNEIVIQKAGGALTIAGSGANNLTIDGGAGSNRIFYTDNASLTISGVVLTGGGGAGINNGRGGAIYAQGGSLTLDRVHITDNSVSEGIGGGVYLLNGVFRITDSTISGNTAFFCGGFYNVFGTLTVVNSTVSANTATNSGGGFCNFGNTDLRNTTVTNNVAPSGGGVYSGVNGLLTFGNTIVAGNIAADNSFPEIRFEGGQITSAGYNLVGDAAGDSSNTKNPITYQPTDILDVNPKLGILKNNGGTTPTHELLMESPAINAGNNSDAPATDQRGFTRIVRGVIDIGAYESDIPRCTYSISSSSQNFTAEGGNGLLIISTQSGCNFSTVINDSFITFTSTTNSLGSTFINFRVSPNTGASRTGTVTVAGQTFTINQAGVKSRKRARFF